MKLRPILMVVLITFCILPAFADTLTFTGGAPGQPGYVADISTTGVFSLIAPITTLQTGLGGTYNANVVFFVQTGIPIANDSVARTLGYSGGAFGMYSVSDWDFATEHWNSGATALMSGTLGNSVAIYLQQDPSNPNLFLTVFLAQLNDGTLAGTFGGYDLAQNSPFAGGGVGNISLDVLVDPNSGIISIPVETKIVITPEPSTLVLLVSGIGGIYWRRRG
jgi:hypothetical protein